MMKGGHGQTNKLIWEGGVLICIILVMHYTHTCTYIMLVPAYVYVCAIDAWVFVQ